MASSRPGDGSDDRRRGGAARHAGRATGLTAGFFLALLLAPLPETWRDRLVRRLDLSVARYAIVSAVAQFIAGMVMLGLGYLPYMDGLSEQVTAQAEAAAGPRGDPTDQIFAGHALLWLNPLLPVLYVLTTPWGFLSALVTFGGAVRSLQGAITRETPPDPTLALIDWVRRHLQGRASTASREKRKGPPLPDRVFHGDGSLGWHVRIVSREDYPWREGISVLIDGEAHRLVSRRETTDGHGHLRTAYELRRQAAAEAMRGMQPYSPALPPLVSGPDDDSGRV